MEACSNHKTKDPVLSFHEGEIVIKWFTDVYNFDVGSIDVRQVMQLVNAINNEEPNKFTEVAMDGHQVMILVCPPQHTVVFSRSHSERKHRCEVAIPKQLALQFFNNFLAQRNVLVELRQVLTPARDVLMLNLVLSSGTSIIMKFRRNSFDRLKEFARIVTSNQAVNYATTANCDQDINQLEYSSLSKQIKFVKTTCEGDLETVFKISVNSEVCLDGLREILKSLG